MSDVELAAAELAHADDHEFLLAAVDRHGHAVAGHELLAQDVVGGFDGDVGQQRHRLGDFGQIGQAGNVAHQYVADDPRPQLAQHRLEVVVVDFLVAQEVPQRRGVEGRVDAQSEARGEPAAAVELAAQKARAGEGVKNGLGQGCGLFGHGRGRLVECEIVYVRPELCLLD